MFSSDREEVEGAIYTSPMKVLFRAVNPTAQMPCFLLEPRTDFSHGLGQPLIVAGTSLVISAPYLVG